MDAGQIGALALYVVLGSVEYFVIDRALREWLAMKGWTIALMAALAVCFPALGGVVACGGAVLVLGWPWWLAGTLFIGGTGALVVMAGFAALWGDVGFF
jgi:hypothetical protein